jgi:hypothetical protein
MAGFSFTIKGAKWGHYFGGTKRSESDILEFVLSLQELSSSSWQVGLFFLIMSLVVGQLRTLD